MSGSVQLTPEQVAALIRRPHDARMAYWKERAERKLIDYGRLLWSSIVNSPLRVNWAVEAVADHLQALTEKQLRKLLILIPPGFGKSLWTSVLWPSWEWGPRNRRWREFLALSYSESLAIGFNVKCRTVVDSRMYRALWRDGLYAEHGDDMRDRFHFHPQQDEKGKFALIKPRKEKSDPVEPLGQKTARGILGTVTGDRGHVVILDDPNNVKETESEAVTKDVHKFVAEVMPTRYIDYNDRETLIVQQRTGPNDATSLVIGQARELGYEVLCLEMRYEEDHPARYWIYDDKTSGKRTSAIGFADPRKEGELLMPERYSEQALREMEAELMLLGGTFAVDAQLQQRPSSRGGTVVKEESFRYCDPHEVPSGGRTARGWDLAGSIDPSSPWTAGVKMRRVQGKIYVLDVRRERLEPHAVDILMRTTAESDGHDVVQDYPQDPGQAGKAQKSSIAANLAEFEIYASPEVKKKNLRFEPFASQIALGNVVLVRGPWNRPYVAELIALWGGRFSDQADASARAYHRLIRTPDVVPSVGPMLIQG